MNRLCIDLAGRVSEPCTRDNVKESYLTPIDHPVTVRLTGPVPVGATCAWSFDDGDGPQASTFDCAEPVNLRVRYGRTTVATVDVSSGRTAASASPPRSRCATSSSPASATASPPAKAIRTARSRCPTKAFASAPISARAAAQYYRPSRAGYKGGRACEAPDPLPVWQRQSALWFNSACHRSLYSYQTRTALALAVQYPHIAVTYLPLACTGATIADGLFGSQRARECPPSKSASTCQGTVNGQLAELREALTAAKRRQPDRKLDLVLLSIGANDIYFSGLVADVIVDTATERALFRRSGVMATVDDSRAALTRDLPQGFAKLREALKPLVGDLSRVVYISYANPTLAQGGAPCPGGRAGFDIHPSFNAAAAAARRRVELRAERIPAAAEGARAVPGRHPVPQSARRSHDLRRWPSGRVRQSRFLRPRRKAIRNSTAQCFSANGDSFDPDIVTAASQPMLCGRSAGEYRAYLPRARWIRDANDSYFAAMTYPQGLPSRSSRPISMTRPGACCRRSMAARCIRAPKATPRWRMPPAGRGRGAAARCRRA